MIVILWQVTRISILFLFLSSGVPNDSQGTDQNSHRDSSKKPRVDVKVDELPKPIPKVLDTLKRIGNNVGDEISKASEQTADAVKKAVQADEPSTKK